MNKERLFNAITDIDDEIIEEAKVNNEKVKINKRTNIKIKRILAIAASLIILVAIGLFIGKGESKYIKPIADVLYPKAYAFEDYDAWRKILEKNPLAETTIKTINDFAYKSSSLILKEAKENTNYSPLSLYYALALASSGAEAKTQQELLDLLGMEDSKVLSQECGNLYRLLYRDNKIGKLKIANSIWLGKDFHGQPLKFNDIFTKNAVENFYASSYSVDFSNPETAEAMGTWIKENTNGRLSPEIKIDSEQILSIINTVYFYDQWIARFNKDKTLEDTFYLLNDEEVKVDFMNQTMDPTPFFKGEDFTRSSLALKNGGSMTFILPDDNISLYDLLSSADKMKELFQEGEELYGEVVWKIPKFKFDSKFNLIEILKELGVNKAFEADADFSGITDHMAYISDIQQETMISIDEIGVEAAAFTQIDYAGSAMPEGRADMILNRPFIYGISEPNGSLLFIGICVNPAH